MTSPSWNATYRIQLTPAFGFHDAAAIVDYLRSLGISHLYLSPIFEATPGSTHGYDQTDPTRIRAELGGDAGFEVLAHAARNAGLGILLDIVPNHMAAHHANPWWFGLLRGGPGSEYDRFFDVDWEQADGKIVLPVLGAPLAEVIAKGEITVEPTKSGERNLRYFDKAFPLRMDPPELQPPHSQQTLLELLSRQHFELTYWREGLKRINYRRFFDISDLAGIRIEDPIVFTTLHAKLLDLVARGFVTAIRVDHIDGLLDPLQYLNRLRQSLDAARPDGPLVPVFVEKILAPGELLPDTWPVDGTTGYEFLAATTSIMTAEQGVSAMRRHAIRTGAGVASFEDLATACKREIAMSILEPELIRVCLAVETAFAAAGVEGDSGALRSAVTELSACFPGYRTYADDSGIGADDQMRIRRAAEHAGKGNSPALQGGTLSHLTELLTLSGPFESDSARPHALRALRLWQQFTGPLAAKGIEDTALYRDMAIPALNDVGSSPERAEPLAAIRLLARQRIRHPMTLNATDTHDAKRSEDVRARLALLSHLPGSWEPLLEEAMRTLSAHADDDPSAAPDPATLSLLVYSAFALWPEGANPDKPLSERLAASLFKSAREAKLFTSWTNPKADFEAACRRAVEALLFSASLAHTRSRLDAFSRTTRAAAARLSLGAVLLKTLFPGTPDWYQGAECRLLSLVDPDNRRPVDFELRRRLLGEIAAAWATDPASAAADILQDPATDKAKLFITWRALRVRRALLSAGHSIELDSFTASPTHWNWTISAGGHRCTIDLTVLEDQAIPAGHSTPPGSIDQLSARPSDSLTPWISVVIQGLPDLL